MEVLVPTAITYEKLISSNINVSTSPEWASSQTYADEDKVKVSYDEDHGVRVAPVLEYESLADSNIGNYPPYVPLKWSEVGPTNRWAMFDNSSSTQTIADGTEVTDPGDIVVRINTSKTSNIVFLNLDATDVEVTTYDGTGTIIGSTQTFDLEESNSYSWSDYFFRDFSFKKELTVTIPLRHVSETVVKIKHTASGIFPKCGVVSIGIFQDIGYTEYGASVGILRFDKITRDTFGNASILKGNYVNTIDLDIVVEASRFDSITRILADVGGVGTVFQANNEDTNFERLQIFGFLRDWSAVISNATLSQISLEIEGLL